MKDGTIDKTKKERETDRWLGGKCQISRSALLQGRYWASSMPNKEKRKDQSNHPTIKMESEQPFNLLLVRKLFAKILEQEHGQTGDGIQKESQ